MPSPNLVILVFDLALHQSKNRMINICNPKSILIEQVETKRIKLEHLAEHSRSHGPQRPGADSRQDQARTNLQESPALPAPLQAARIVSLDPTCSQDGATEDQISSRLVFVFFVTFGRPII